MHGIKPIFSTLKKALLLSLGVMSLALSTAGAGPLIFDGLDNCTTLNCGAVVLNGISQRNAFGDSVPFVAQVFADVNQCMRLDVTSQTADMEIVLVSPSGRVWRNDDANGDRPLIKARGDAKGYYTLQINFFNGIPSVNSVQLFTLAYGLYVPGTPNNCPSLTSPSSIRAGAEKSEAE